MKMAKNNMYRLDSDRQDVVEGFVQKNKNKSTSEIYSELKKDNYFKDVDEKTLKSAINDTKKIYKIWDKQRESRTKIYLN